MLGETNDSGLPRVADGVGPLGGSNIDVRSGEVEIGQMPHLPNQVGGHRPHMDGLQDLGRVAACATGLWLQAPYAG